LSKAILALNIGTVETRGT